MVKTYVELKGEKGSIYFALYWRGKKNVGVGPAMAPAELTIPFLPVSKAEFAGYRIDSATVVKAVFEAGKGGDIRAVRISAHKARKVRKKQNS